MKTTIEQLLTQALAVLRGRGVLPNHHDAVPQITSTRDPAHGDFATNLALVLAKPAGLNPRTLAGQLIEALPASADVDKVEIAGPGFINFFLKTAAGSQIVARILQEKDQFGRGRQGLGKRVLLEFVSANPTGPLHVGHGRQAALGDALAELLGALGFEVSREFYYNDAGVQIHNLAVSVQARARGLRPGDVQWPEQAYNGDYIADIATDFVAGKSVNALDGEMIVASGDIDDLDAIRRFAVTYLRREQDIDLQAFGVRFDNYYLESSLYTDGKVEQTVQDLIASGKTFEQDGALWLHSTEFGDDKDRVMRKSDGQYTYFVPDVAYHVGKWRRGFDRAINIQGTDHHGTIARVRAGLQALQIGIPADYPQYILHNMVKVMRGGEEVKISKRAGSYVTLRDLIDWVGRDAVRFFLMSRRADSHFVFDIDVALAQNDENPVYYLQYAHARIASVFRQAQESGHAWSAAEGLAALDRLTESHEAALFKQLGRYPEVLEKAATAGEPHQLTYYLRDLATDFHSYYNAHQFLLDDAALRNARLSLVAAVAQVLRNGLTLLGVTAPEKM